MLLILYTIALCNLYHTASLDRKISDRKLERSPFPVFKRVLEACAQGWRTPGVARLQNAKSLRVQSDATSNLTEMHLAIKSVALMLFATVFAKPAGKLQMYLFLLIIDLRIEF